VGTARCVRRGAGRWDTRAARHRHHQLGETPEEIALSYGSISLADVYATIAYYLRHTAEVDEYLRKREKIRREIQPRFPTAGLRERLLARAAKLRAP